MKWNRVSKQPAVRPGKFNGGPGLSVRFVVPVLCAAMLCACGSDLPQGEDSGRGETSSMSIFEVTGYQKISPEQAKKIMDENEDCIILDVRSDEEYAEQRIANAMLIPDFEIAERAETDLSDKDALILVYCRRGYRSATAAHTLIDLGYTQVYDFGGIEDWPYETLN